jgi:GPH family glycoside/pentoside/hexuronide:cation symporter
VKEHRLHQSIAHADRVSVPAKVGYGIGAIGGQIFRDTPALILPIYMITVLGVPAWMAGIAILIPKAWIIFWDPLVGGWSDRKRGSWGRAPFLLAGALLAGLAFVLMFSAPDFASPWASAGYITVTFALASTAYSLFSVPYLSVAAEMSINPRERTRILAVRICFLSVGVAVGGYALPAAHSLGEGWTGFNRMGMLYGLACAVSAMK